MNRGERGGKYQTKAALLTGVQRVADVCVAARVLVQGLDPDDLRARGGHVRDDGLVAGAQEGRRVVVAVLHVNYHFCKIPFHRDLLVKNLKGSGRGQRIMRLLYFTH